MELYTCSQENNSDFLFEAQNKFILYNVCDNYFLINMHEYFLLHFQSNGILLAMVIMVCAVFLLKVFDIIMDRFIISDLIFTKKYFKLSESIIALILFIAFTFLNLIMPRKVRISNLQIRSSTSILNITLFCLVIPMSLFLYLQERKGIIFPKRVYNFTVGSIFIINIMMDFYLSYTNRIDYILITGYWVFFVIYLIGFFIFLKLDVSEQRNLAKKEGFKLTSNYVILEFEKEELGSGAKQLNDSENPDDMSESDLMSESMSMSNSLANSKAGKSNNFVTESALNIGQSSAEEKIFTEKRDSLEDFMENYELELDEKIRENQKSSVEKEFGTKLFNNEDEQREILRNKKITLWDKVFTEFSSGENQNRLDAIFDKIFISFFAFSLPSLKNPLMRTNWMVFIINNCIIFILMGAQLIFKFHIHGYLVFLISFTMTALLFILQYYKVYDYTVHRYICSFLTAILGYIYILDLCFIMTDTIVFFLFYFKINILMTLGGMRAIRYMLPSFFLIFQLCKNKRYMIALLYSFLFSIGTYTVSLFKTYLNSINNLTTIYDGFIKTLSLYEKQSVPLLFMSTTFMYFYIILMSFLMVIKKFKFDMSLILLNLILVAVFIYSVIL